MGLKIDNGVLLSPDANGNYIERAAFSTDGDLVFKNTDGSSRGFSITSVQADERYLQLVAGGTITGAFHANHTSNTYTGASYKIGDANTHITKNGDGAIKIQTPSGYVVVGPGNTSYSHFSTDRGRFYFNQQIEVAGHVSSYSNGTYNLGSTSLRWGNLYTVDINASGTVTASGGNSTNWNTAYSYSQVGHLPLSGGTLTGDLRFNQGSGYGRIAYVDNYHGMILRGYPNSVTGSVTVGDVTSLVQHSGDFRFYRTNGSVNELYFQVNSTAAYHRGNQIWDTSDFTSTNVSNWNTAYGWGNHASAGYAFSAHTHDDRYFTETESDARYLRSDTYNSNYGGLQVWRNIGTNTGSWPDTDHTLGLENNDAGNIVINFHRAGYTSHNLLYNADGFKFDTNLQVTGTIFATGGNSSNWNTAYGWGNHASAGYLTSASIGNYATQQDITNAINNLIDSSPGTLDTLNELAAAINDDPNFYQTVNNKLSLSGGTLSGGLNMGNNDITGVNNIVINDPGPSEGIAWNNGNGWNIWESPDDLVTNSAGNLQFVRSGTRVMTLDTSNHMNVAGNVKAYAIQGNANVSGTGAASYHPSGIYSTGTNWLYGTMYLNTNAINDTGNIRTYNSSHGLWARYNAGDDNYAASLYWNTLQLGNNGANYLYVGKTNAGGYLDIYTNVTGDRSTSGANLAARFHANGRVSIGTGTDSGYSLTVGGSVYSDTWFRVGGSAGYYFESYGGGFYMNDTTWVRIYGDKSLYTAGTIQAGRFEDANDSNYYVNPNGISRIYGLTVAGEASNTDSVNQLFLWSNDATTSAIGFKANGGEFANPTGNGDGYNTYFTMDTDGRGWVFRRGTGGSDFNSAYTSGWILNNGVWQANASMRAPIFYDSNDTSYYLDPASASNLKTVTFNSTTTGTDVLAVNGVNGRLFTVTDDLSDSLFSVNTIAGLPVIEAFADNTVKIGKYGANSITISGGSIGINTDTPDPNFPFYVGDRSTAGRYVLANPGMGFNLADNYAQLQLYGTSGAYIDFNTTANDSGGRIMYNGNFSVNGNMTFNNSVTVTGTLTNAGTSYLGIIYDYDNNNYYLNPNGTSQLSTVNFGGGYIEPAGTNSMNLRRVNSITFAPDNSWNNANYHGIMSIDISGNVADSISINSYNDIILRVDSNSNNAESYVRISNNSTGNGTITYFGYDGTNIVSWFGGNVTAVGTITASGGNSSQWNTAYGWGNHAGLYLGISAKAADSNLLDGIDSSQFMRSDTADSFTAVPTFAAGDNGTFAARTGYSDFLGYNTSYGSYIGGGVSNANRYIYAGGYFYDGSTVQTLIHSGNIGSQSVNYATTAGSADNIDGWAFRNTGGNSATNADTIDSNGISYYTAGVTNFSGNASDGALYSQRHDSNWQHQIAGDYRSGMIAVRGKNAGTWQAWRTVIDSSTIGSQSVNYASSAGNADTVDGKHANNAAGGIPTLESNGYWYAPSWINVGTTGIFSGTNNAHFRPNTSSYGSWEIIGSKNGWSGIYFNDSGNTLMANANDSGFYNVNAGWQIEWYNGTLSISKQANGGGTLATVLDSSNFANYAATSGHNHNGTYLGVSDKAADSNLLDGLDLHTGRNNEANKVVRTDGNGYIQAGWINTTSGAFTSGINKIYCSDDDYVRYQTPANFISNLGLIYSGNISSQSVSYANSAGSATSATQVVTIQDAAPGGAAGKLWWESDTGKLKVYYGSAWVDAVPMPDMALYYSKAGGAITGDVTIQQTLTVVGNVLIEGTLTETSDITLKENIAPLQDSLNKVLQLNGVSFNKKNNPGVKEIGFIAQEVEQVLPELVTETDEGIKTVSYSRVTAVLVETIKEQQAQIDELKDIVNKLVDRLNS